MDPSAGGARSHGCRPRRAIGEATRREMRSKDRRAGCVHIRLTASRPKSVMFSRMVAMNERPSMKPLPPLVSPASDATPAAAVGSAALISTWRGKSSFRVFEDIPAASCSGDQTVASTGQLACQSPRSSLDPAILPRRTCRRKAAAPSAAARWARSKSACDSLARLGSTSDHSILRVAAAFSC